MTICKWNQEYAEKMTPIEINKIIIPTTIDFSSWLSIKLNLSFQYKNIRAG